MTEPAAAAARAPEQPFVGLDNYSSRDAAVFFGRDTEIGTLIGSFRASRFMLLYANSGVGKSSLLRAGVLPKLVEVAAKDMDEGDPPRYVPAINSTWGGDAVERVRDAVVAVVTEAPFGWTRANDEIPHGDLQEIVEVVTERLDSTLLLVFDQFEEYFLHQDEESRAAFARAVGACVNRVDLRVNFLVSIREDAYARLGSLFKGAVPNVYGSYVNLAPLDVERADAAIRKPLRVFGAEIEKDLVTRVLEGVTHAGRPGAGRNGHNGNGNGHLHDYVATPYLQLVMRELWEHETATTEAGGKLLRLETLEELHGTEQIIRSHVSKAIAGLDDEQKEVAADVLRYLAPSDRGKLTLTVGRLASFTGRDEDELRPVLEHLLRNRLVATAGDDGYEIFHDVLASHIIEWRTAYERERQTERERLEREKRVAAEAREQAERAAKEREERNAKRFRRLSFTLVVVAAAAIALILWNQAQDQRDRSQSRRLSADAIGYPPIELSSLYALEAYRLWPTIEARAAILRLADNHELGPPLPGTSRITGVAMSPDRLILATATDGLTDSGRYRGSVQLWSAASRRPLGRPLDPHAGAINGVAFSPDGRVVATAGADGDVRLWNVATHHQYAPLPGVKGAPINAVAFSPDGRLLSSSSCFREFQQPTSDHTITLWDVRHGGRIAKLKGSPAPVCTTAFSPDGKLLASGGDDDMVRLWSVRSGRQIGRPLKGHTGAVSEVAFSPDGKELASASAGTDDTIRLWDVAGRKTLKKFTGHSGVVTAIAFSPDGRTLASVSRDRSLRLWPVKGEDKEELGRPFLSHSAAIFSVAYEDDRTLVSGGRDGVRIWGVRGTRELGRPITADPNGVANVAFSPDAGKLAWTGFSGYFGLWDLVRGKQIDRINAPTDNLNSLAFSPDGSRVAWAADTQRKPVAPIQGYDVLHRRPLRLMPDPPPPRKGAKVTPHKIRGLAWSPDGKTIAYDDIDATDPNAETGAVKLWDVVHRRPAGTVIRHRLEMHSVEFSPDGKLLAIGGEPHTVLLWDVKRKRIVARLRGHTEFVFDVAFSPDGKHLASASRDGSVILWDVGARRQVGVPLFRRSTVYAVAFSPDGKSLVEALDDGTLQLWDVATHRPIGGPLEGHGATVFGTAFAPRRGEIASASADGTIRVWRNYSLGWAIRRLCTYIDTRHAEKTWNQVEPSTGFRDPC